ncbi:MAG: NAD(P)/FAD-dependent oxidoreductase [Lachnospiraceae bacterium]|nr:NAD(P)/FAD-dependent oxidoreductase [Lachnospiraceae bacterium]
MKTIIIGGGPAGMIAAISAADSGSDVILFEKNEKLGKKLFITGKGRCNVTNNCEKDKFFDNIMGNSKFLYSAFAKFDNHALMELIESLGTPLKVERGERVFPVSDHSSDIIRALTKGLKDRAVEVRLNDSVKEILTEDNIAKGVLTDKGEKYTADKVIVCTGGVSYKSTGSTGDGYIWGSKTGHRITTPKPSLVPLVTHDKWVYDLQGLSLKNVKLSLYIDGKVKYSDMGEMLFTHFGLSGPLVLTASAYLASAKDYKEAYVIIDNKPALSFEEFDKRLIRELTAGNNKEIKNILGEIYPSKMAKIICGLAGIDQYKKCNEIKKEERNALVEITKKMKIMVNRTRDFDEAIITHGGISLKDVNPKTMESKLIKGLYFAGEVLDLDALTGGFNLQIAFSTGYLAGCNEGGGYYEY